MSPVVRRIIGTAKSNVEQQKGLPQSSSYVGSFHRWAVDCNYKSFLSSSQNVLFQEQKGNQNKTKVTPPRNLRLENEEFISQHPLAHRWSCDMAQHLLACSFPVACSFFLSLSDLLNLNRKFLGFRQLCLFIWGREWVNSTDLFLPIMHSSSLIQYSRYYDQGTVSECGRSSHCSRYYVSGHCVRECHLVGSCKWIHDFQRKKWRPKLVHIHSEIWNKTIRFHHIFKTYVC